MSEIVDAVDRLQQRKQAAGIADALAQSADAQEDAMRRMFSGTDIDLKELKEVSGRYVRLGNVMIAITGAPGVACGAMFIEGLAAGLMLAEARAREEAAK